MIRILAETAAGARSSRTPCMAVKRIVANIAVAEAEVDAARSFHGTVLGLDMVMHHGWIVTFAAAGAAAVPQISVASEGLYI